MLKVNDHLYIENNETQQVTVYWRKVSIPHGLAEELKVDQFMGTPALDLFDGAIHAPGKKAVEDSSWIGCLPRNTLEVYTVINGICIIQHKGYLPCQFVRSGSRNNEVRVVHGVAFKGDHVLAEALL